MEFTIYSVFGLNIFYFKPQTFVAKTMFIHIHKRIGLERKP